MHVLIEKDMLEHSFSSPRKLHLEKTLLSRNCLPQHLSFQWAYFMLACSNQQKLTKRIFQKHRYTLLPMMVKPLKA